MAPLPRIACFHGGGSSAAIFAYTKAPCLCPAYTDMDNIEPSDWVKFILDNNYA